MMSMIHAIFAFFHLFFIVLPLVVGYLVFVIIPLISLSWRYLSSPKGSRFRILTERSFSFLKSNPSSIPMLVTEITKCFKKSESNFGKKIFKNKKIQKVMIVLMKDLPNELEERYPIEEDNQDINEEKDEKTKRDEKIKKDEKLAKLLDNPMFNPDKKSDLQNIHNAEDSDKNGSDTNDNDSDNNSDNNSDDDGDNNSDSDNNSDNDNSDNDNSDDDNSDDDNSDDEENKVINMMSNPKFLKGMIDMSGDKKLKKMIKDPQMKRFMKDPEMMKTMMKMSMKMKGTKMKDIKAKSVSLKQSKSCVVCSKIEDLQSCAKCKLVQYCSREHQVADWKNHKEICNILSGPSNVSTPIKV
jgi:hypothetical protein